MDLNYADSDKKDIAVLLEYDFDLAFGKDENNFECKMDYNNHCCKAGYYLYIENTEYGGIINSIQADTDAGEVIYGGRTWHGILGAKILKPNAGEDYLVLSGEANTVLGALINRMGLYDLFCASGEDSGIEIENYQMNRYIDGYTGIRKMLKNAGAKLKINYINKMVTLAAVPVVDYTKDEQFDSDYVPIKVKRNYGMANHLICLGKGELSERTVIHLYADSDGKISRAQSLIGLAEVEEVFDYPSVESSEELERKGMERLAALQDTDEAEADFTSEDECYDVGDIVGAVERITGLTVAAEITKKIVTIKNDVTNISYKVGE